MTESTRLVKLSMRMSELVEHMDGPFRRRSQSFVDEIRWAGSNIWGFNGYIVDGLGLEELRSCISAELTV